MREEGEGAHVLGLRIETWASSGPDYRLNRRRRDRRVVVVLVVVVFNADCTVHHQATDCVLASLRELFSRITTVSRSCKFLGKFASFNSASKRPSSDSYNHITMSKPSSRLIQGFLRLHSHHHQLHLPKSPPTNAHSSSHFATGTVDPAARSSSPSYLPRSFLFSRSSSSAFSNAQSSCKSRAFTNFAPSEALAPSRSVHVSHRTGQALSKSSSPGELGRLRLNCYGVRHFSFQSSGNGGFAKKAFEKPAMSVLSTFSKYREAIGLQVESFLRSNYLFLVGAGAVLVCALLWRIMFGIANTFVGISEGMAKYGFLALSSAIVAFAGLYVRARITINPDRIYRMAMRKLNTHAGILEVMGAPLTGSDLRAYVMSGGGVTFKKFKPMLRSKRCFLIFPIRGSERKGLVSVEVKKKKGQYDVKLLAVDVPMSSGPDQRLYLIGDEEEYKVGGGLISELRDPVLKAMSATKEFDDLDEIEEAEDAERELREAEKKHHEEMEKLEKAGRE